MLVFDAKLRGDRNLTVVNIYRLGSRPQKLWIEIQMQSVAFDVCLLPINGQPGRDNGDRSRFQTLLKVLVTDPRPYVRGRTQLDYDAVILKRGHGPFRDRLPHLKCAQILPAKGLA